MPYGVSATTWKQMAPSDRASVRREYEKRQKAAQSKQTKSYIENLKGMGSARTAQGVLNKAGIPGYVSQAEKRNRARARQIQSALRKVGYRISVDGVWGPQTEAAYNHFITPKRGKRPLGLEFVGQGADQWLKYNYQKERAEAMRRVQAQASRIETAIRNAQKAGDIDPLSAKIAIASFWQKVGLSDEFGQFKGTVKSAEQQLKQLRQIQADKVSQTAALKKAQADRNSLSGKLKGAFTTVTTFPSRFAFGFQRAADLQAAEDKAGHRKGRFQWSQAYRETFEKFGTALVAGAASSFRFASRMNPGSLAAEVAESIDDEHERIDLVNRGIMETPGQRFARDILGKRNEMAEHRDAGRRRGLSGRELEDYIDREYEAARNRFIQAAGAPSAGFGRDSYKGTVLSGVGDFATQVLIDPTNLVGAGLVRATTVVGAKAAQNVLKTAAGQALIQTAARQAVKAAARKDISLLLKTVPGLGGAAASGTKAALIAALTDPSGRAALRFLENAGRTVGGDAAGAAVRRQSIEEASRVLAAQGGELTHETAAALLRVALGGEWRPTLSLKSRVAGAALKGAINEPAAVAVLDAMSWFSKGAKSVSFSHLARRALTSGKGGYVGRRVFDDPRLLAVGPLVKKFAESSEMRDVKAQADMLRRREVGATKKGKPKYVTANTLKDYNRRWLAAMGVADSLPDGVIKDSINVRMDALRVDIVADLEAKLAHLTEADKALLQQSDEYLKARRAVLQTEALAQFGKEGAVKWVALLSQLDDAIAKVADVKLDKGLTKRLSRFEKDILTARAVSKQAYANAERVLARDIADFETLQRHGHSQQLRQGLLRRLGERARRVPLVFADMTWSKDHINLESVDERGTFARDFARLLNAPFSEAEEARWAATQAGLGDDNAGDTMRDIVRSLMENWAARQGHSPEEVRELLAVQDTSLNEWLRENGGALVAAEMAGRRRALNRAGIEEPKSKEFAPPGQGGIYGRVLDDEGSLVTLDRPAAVTQAQNWMAVPAVDELKLWSIVTKRNRVDNSLFSTAGLNVQAAARTVGGRVRQVVYPVHRFWKQWVVVGGLFRYVLRVAVLEERNRMVAAQGMGSALPIGIYARRMNDYMMQTQHVGFTNWSSIGMDDVPDFFAHRKFAKAGDLGILNRDQDGYIENLWHLVNHQVNPDSDPMAGMLLQTLHRKGSPEWKRDQEDAVNWLRTEDGRTYLAQYRALNGDVDAQEVVDNWSEWAASIVPNDELAQKRLEGIITMRDLDENKLDWPAEIYGRPFTGGAVEAAKHPFKTLQRLVIQTPTTGLNRQPFAFIEYRNELRALTSAGIDFQEASRLANQHAIKRTNSILYDASQRSRFAAAMDPVFPFQAAREEQIRVWAKLTKENPARVIAQVARIARVFNAGEDEGVFYKDERGEYRMRVRLGPLRQYARSMADFVPDWVPLEKGLRSFGENAVFDEMELSFRLRDLLFIQQSEMPAFTTNPAAGWAIGTALPQVGGPWFQVAAGAFLEHNKQLFPKNPYFQAYLFPFGVSNWQYLGRPEIRYLFGALTGANWNDEESERLQNRVIRDFYHRMGRNPTEEELDEAFRGIMLLRAGLGVTMPARVIPDLGGELEFRRLTKKYQEDFGDDYIGKLLGNHPNLMPYIVSSKHDPAVDKYRDAKTGNVDWNRLRAEEPELWQAISIQLEDTDFQAALGEETWANFVRDREELDPEKYKARITRANDNNRMMEGFFEAIGTESPLDQAKKLQAWERHWQNSDVFKARKDDWFRLRRLDNILKVGDRATRERLLAELRVDAGWSQQKLDKNIADRKAKHVSFDGYMSARSYDQLDELWRTTKGTSLKTFVNDKLTPHEATKFLALKMADAETYDEWNEANKLRGALWAEHLDVLSDKTKRQREAEAAATGYWQKRLDKASANIGRLYDRINVINKQLDGIGAQFEAADKANKFIPGLGTAYRRLKSQRDALYAQIRGIQNAMYNTVPDLRSAYDEVKYMKAHEAWRESGRKGGKFDPEDFGIATFDSGEENRWERMPPRVQTDYLNGLVRSLNTAKLKWEWMTDFQKDMLYDMGLADKASIDKWRRNAKAVEDGYKKRGRKGWEVWGHKLGEGFGELAFALELFKQYNKRGNMPKPEAELAQLAAIGDNPLARADYLRNHPRVREWIRLGPMMQMPAGIGEVVRHIMTKYNRWEDPSETGRAEWSWDEVIEVAWARQMLQKYTKRKPGEVAPKAYELWMKMPTGKAKAVYLEKHPEIERWLQRGPMSNMPDEYQEVVRDVMERFGLWEDRQDPLGDLINQYYRLPQHARQAFLEEHPEIMAYWRALRTGAEREMFDLAQRYFALSDPTAKREFLRAYPQLQDYFVDERHRRYQRFLSNVARYLGSYPDLANSYLKDQTKFLHELVRKYAEKPLVTRTATVRYGNRRS